jgi:group I intron endonuclease
MAGVVYQVICIPTGLSYVGQAKNYKTKNGTPYHYGATGRWNDHVSSAKTRNTPLCQAIKDHGRDNFTITVLEEAPLEQLDEREAVWLARLNCIHPNGYNVATHGRNRHRETSNLHIFYVGRVASAVIHPIRRGGELRLVYVYLNLNGGERERLAFGQKEDTIYDEALREATTFLKQVECEYHVSKDYSTELSDRYQSKLDEFKNKTITSVRITSASSLIAVYIGTSEMKWKKDHIRICFGGKNIDKNNAYATAKQFVNQLGITDDNIIQDSIRSQQQATAS